MTLNKAHHQQNTSIPIKEVSRTTSSQQNFSQGKGQVRSKQIHETEKLVTSFYV